MLEVTQFVSMDGHTVRGAPFESQHEPNLIFQCEIHLKKKCFFL